MKIEVIQGDITRIAADAIVNAANEGLRGGGGVDGAIHAAGGPAIMEECRQIGHCPTGEAVMTAAGNLPARKVIHSVGPVWRGGHHNEESLLAAAYSNSLALASKHHLRKISMPNISTGVYGFPKEKAAQIALAEVRKFLQTNNDFEIIFVCYDAENFALYQRLVDV
jgi:O-acetyl-ADP-ribose deacetylase (regulator of RNase III)